MRDLTDKMKDLKGKISSLRDKAREENLKRRSVQNLRTASPFTAAEKWYMSSAEYGEGLTADAGVATRDSWTGPSPMQSQSLGQEREAEEEPAVKEDMYEASETTSTYHDIEDVPPASDEDSEEFGNVVTSFDDGSQPGNGNVETDNDESDDTEQDSEGVTEELDQDGSDGWEATPDQYEDSEDVQSIDGDSIYHETSQVPLSHEDREDAFDYEHLFLHSALGSMSQQANRRRSDSVDSYTSEASVETTRGLQPAFEADLERPSGHRRQHSVDTVSTMATFETATEGYEPAYADEEEYEESSSFNIEAVRAGSRQGRDTSSEGNSRPSSILKSGVLQRQNAAHRPSVSSFTSVSSGTTREFPLLNKPKPTTTSGQQQVYSAPNSAANSPIHSLLSNHSAPDASMVGVAISSDVAMSADSLRAPTIVDRASLQPSPVSMLDRGDQILVERLVESMGKCVLGLQEARRATPESRMWRRRLDAAMRVLEGQDGIM
jgi:hypothetical protein